jgi:hypothetical protein
MSDGSALVIAQEELRLAHAEIGRLSVQLTEIEADRDRYKRGLHMGRLVEGLPLPPAIEAEIVAFRTLEFVVRETLLWNAEERGQRIEAALKLVDRARQLFTKSEQPEKKGCILLPPIASQHAIALAKLCESSTGKPHVVKPLGLGWKQIEEVA